jgi:hypothetical protein
MYRCERCESPVEVFYGIAHCLNCEDLSDEEAELLMLHYLEEEEYLAEQEADRFRR